MVSARSATETGGTRRPTALPNRNRPDWALATRRLGFAVVAAGVDLLGFAIAAVVASVSSISDTGGTNQIALLLALMAASFVVITALKCQYDPASYLTGAAQLDRTTTTFAVAFFFTAMIGLVAGARAELLSARSVALLGLGLPPVILGRLLLARRVKASLERAGLAPRRMMLLGSEAEIDAFYRRCPLEDSGMQVVTAAVLRGSDTLTDDLTLAATMARVLRVDDVFILSPWSEIEMVESCLHAFLCVPAALHLGPGPLLDRLAQVRVVKTGRIATLALDRSSLSGSNAFLKRALDVALSATALFLLAPLALVLAIAIKLDSKGPVLFRQRRYGFNQEPFRIFKFRSMYTAEDGAHVKQASQDDPRVTRVGRFMRRTNLDELPQLLNVLNGDMSLVGPRPHAIAHDQLFGPTVSLYGRRHNVKPGITGWAQVNGLRGEVTPETLKARIEHDLHYVDNWSLWLDLCILWRTVTSAKAYLNAY
jgi:Undecaprenyl-phosphate glucose phosphotransferase